MILNVSGRCDIVAFYSEWFINRYREGYVDVRNPFYNSQVSRIFFKDVDLIVFCTKNPIPIIKYLKEIKIPIIFQITLTSYKSDIELNVVDKNKVIDAIKEISDILGIDNVYVRYDPIFISDKYNVNYHVKAFDRMCKLLNGYIKHIIVSFMDDYKNVRNHKDVLNYNEMTLSDYEIIGKNFAFSAKENNMTVQTCAEERNLIEYGFIKEDCVSRSLAFKMTNKKNFKIWKARNNKCCNCVEMVDIGVYNVCSHLCRYCYANYDEKKVCSLMKEHDVNSSLLIGHLKNSDIVKVRKA